METPPSTFASELRDALAQDAAAGAADRGDDGPPAVVSRPRARKPQSRTFPVTVTQMPTVRCQVCGEVVPHLKGRLTAVLTEHYEREHRHLLNR